MMGIVVLEIPVGGIRIGKWQAHNGEKKKQLNLKLIMELLGHYIRQI